MKTYFLIARKQVVIDIVSKKQTTEHRNYTEYYQKKFKNFSMPARLKLRGGYNKDAYYVVVDIKDAEISDYYDTSDNFLCSEYTFSLGNIVDTNVKNSYY